MNQFDKTLSLRWADIDANHHLRHSVYYDFGAQHRVDILAALGLTLDVMAAAGIGPILFREECVFKREILLTDQVTIHSTLVKMRSDGSRWTIRHELIRADNTLCAIITVEGAWIDIARRKLAAPVPPVVTDIFPSFPRSDDFEMI
jgi:acyl-CoA thioester hydrolase